jgi:predicted HD superfamily hydrolase involved in NAD metabolism
MTDPHLETRVREWLGQEHRFQHCKRVAGFAVELARAHGVDERQAYLAAMLHDLARLYPAKRLLEECERRGIEIDAYARENPIVLHAPLASALAAESFGVSDPQVLSAIAKHTLADKAMSPLDAIIYLADTLEPGRTFEARERLATLAKSDLFGALRVTIENSVRYLQESRIEPAPQTAQALAALSQMEV